VYLWLSDLPSLEVGGLENPSRSPGALSVPGSKGRQGGMSGSLIFYSHALLWSWGHSSPGFNPQPLGCIQLFNEVYLHLKKFNCTAVRPGAHVVSEVTFAAVSKWSSQ